MLQKLTKAILPIGVALLMLAPILAFTITVSAQSGPPDLQTGFCEGANFNLSGGDCATGVDTDSFQETITKIVDIISFIVGAIAVVMIIYGGFRYITSGGDTTRVTAAKNTILYGIVGLIIVAIAQVMVKFVLQYFSDSFE